jgi:hypothetical protein
MENDMQNECFKIPNTTNYCNLGSLVEPNKVRSALRSCAKMGSWLVKQCKRAETYTDTLGTASSTADISPAGKRW